MTVRAALAWLLAAFLAAPPVADAKGVVKAQVCGVSKCFTFDRGNSRGKLAFFEVAGDPAPPPRRAAPWYRLRITVGGEDIRRFTFTNAYVPSVDRIRQRAEGGGYEWVSVIPDLRPALQYVAGRLTPLAASKLRGVAAPRAHTRQTGAPAPPAAATAPDPTGIPRPLIVAAVPLAAALLLLARRLKRH